MSKICLRLSLLLIFSKSLKTLGESNLMVFLLRIERWEASRSLILHICVTSSSLNSKAKITCRNLECALHLSSSKMLKVFKTQLRFGLLSPLCIITCYFVYFTFPKIIYQLLVIWFNMLIPSYNVEPCQCLLYVTLVCSYL